MPILIFFIVIITGGCFGEVNTPITEPKRPPLTNEKYTVVFPDGYYAGCEVVFYDDCGFTAETCDDGLDYPCRNDLVVVIDYNSFCDTPGITLPIEPDK